MSRIVMKFGGTSMAGIERIRSVAGRVKREAEAGNEVLWGELTDRTLPPRTGLDPQGGIGEQGPEQPVALRGGEAEERHLALHVALLPDRTLGVGARPQGAADRVEEFGTVGHDAEHRPDH